MKLLEGDRGVGGSLLGGNVSSSSACFGASTRTSSRPRIIGKAFSSRTLPSRLTECKTEPTLGEILVEHEGVDVGRPEVGNELTNRLEESCMRLCSLVGAIFVRCWGECADSMKETRQELSDIGSEPVAANWEVSDAGDTSKADLRLTPSYIWNAEGPTRKVKSIDRGTSGGHNVRAVAAAGTSTGDSTAASGDVSTDGVALKDGPARAILAAFCGFALVMSDPLRLRTG